MNILSILIAKSRRMIPSATSPQRTHRSTVDEIHYFFAILIMLYQNPTIACRITIPVAVDANHSVIAKFDSDA
jgi:hypothetical protein